MDVVFSLEAEKDFLSFERQLQVYFKRHLEKLSAMPPRRHLKRGAPFFVEDVTRQARPVYVETEKELRTIRCFATHKEYERWYLSFKR